MTILSQATLQRLGIETPGPASVDLRQDTIYEIDPDFWARDAPCTYEELARNRRRFNGTLEPGAVYSLDTPNPIAGSRRPVRIATRSSLARLGVIAKGLRRVRDAPPELIPLVARTYGTRVRVPTDYPLAHAIIFDHSVEPLTAPDTHHTLAYNDVAVRNPTVLCDGSIALHARGPFLIYDGEVLDVTHDNNPHFQALPATRICLEPGRLYLAMTEPVRIGSYHAGVLHGTWTNGVVHAGAPLVHPLSEGNQTLEIYVADRRVLSDGQPVCELRLHRLSVPYRNGHNEQSSRYARQYGRPLIKSHHDFHANGSTGTTGDVRT